MLTVLTALAPGPQPGLDPTRMSLLGLDAEHCVEPWAEGDRAPRSAALNRALARATGSHVAVLQAGETLAPGAWDSVRRAWQLRPDVDVFYGDWLQLGADRAPLRRHLALRFDADAQIYHRCDIVPPALFLRRDVFDRIGHWDEWLSELADEELVLRAIKRRLRFVPLAQVLAHSGREPGAPSADEAAERAVLVREYARPKAQAPSALRLLRAGFALRRALDHVTGRLVRGVGA